MKSKSYSLESRWTTRCVQFALKRSMDYKTHVFKTGGFHEPWTVRYTDSNTCGLQDSWNTTPEVFSTRVIHEPWTADPRTSTSMDCKTHGRRNPWTKWTGHVVSNVSNASGLREPWTPKSTLVNKRGPGRARTSQRHQLLHRVPGDRRHHGGHPRDAACRLRRGQRSSRCHPRRRLMSAATINNRFRATSLNYITNYRSRAVTVAR